MKKLYAGIAVIFILIFTLSGFFILVRVKQQQENSIREKYPYTGISTREGKTDLTDSSAAEDWSIELLLSEKDMAIAGQFTSEPQLVEIPIFPEEGTNEYEVTQSLAEEFGKPFEEMVPKLEYYKMNFSRENTLYNRLDDGTAEDITVYVAKDDWEVFPDPVTYSNAILFVDDFPHGGENAVLTSTLGYYYISEKGNVYSAEKFKSLEEFSGETIEEFFEKIAEVREEMTMVK